MVWTFLFTKSVTENLCLWWPHLGSKMSSFPLAIVHPALPFCLERKIRTWFRFFFCNVYTHTSSFSYGVRKEVHVCTGESLHLMVLKCPCLHHRPWQVLNRSQSTIGSDGKFSGMFRGGVEFPDNFLQFIHLVHVECHCLSGKVPRELFEVETVKSFPDVYLWGS